MVSADQQKQLDDYRDEINTKWGEVSLSNNDPSDPGSWGRDSYLVDTNSRVKRLAADVAAVKASGEAKLPNNDPDAPGEYDRDTYVVDTNLRVKRLEAKLDALAEALAGKVDALGAALDSKK